MNVPKSLVDTSNSDYKSTAYIELDYSDSEKNELLLKNATKDLNVTAAQKQNFENLLANPRHNPTIAIFSKNNEITEVETLSYGYSANFDAKNYYILPLLDFRQEVYQNLYLLKYSKNEVEFYSVNANGIELHPEIEFENFAEVSAGLWEEKSIQHHGGENAIHHGQNAASFKGREGEMHINHIAGIATTLNAFLDKHNAKLVIAATTESTSILKSKINPRYHSIISLDGNFDEISEDKLHKQLIQSISEYDEMYIEQIKEAVDIDENKRIQSESFANLMSIVNNGQIETVFIGKLVKFDEDYQNPISPLGANYIAQEVIKLGGNVKFYPKMDFGFVDNNILFKFRF